MGKAKEREFSPHAGIIGSQLSGSLEVVHGIDRHVQQLIGLAQAVPSPIILGVQGCGSPICVCSETSA